MATRTGSYAKHLKDALEHLGNDNALRPLLDGVGAISLEPDPPPSPLHSLAESITGQQLNGRAAQAIFERFLALYNSVLTAEAILNTPEETMRSVGLSRAKVIAIRDLAEKTANKVILERGTTSPGMTKGGAVLPDLTSWRTLRKMNDEEIIEHLTKVRGIGRWTVEMMLIFSLGRLDVWPVGDFAIRKAYGNLLGINEPKPAEMRTRAEVWRPYRSVVARYLWKSL